MLIAAAAGKGSKLLLGRTAISSTQACSHPAVLWQHSVSPFTHTTMSKRGPLDAFFKPLSASAGAGNKKARAAADDTPQPADAAPNNKAKPKRQVQRQQDDVTNDQLAAADTNTTQAAPSASASAPAPAGGPTSGNAFGALMAAAKGGGGSGGSGSAQKKLSAQEMQQQADRNQAAVVAAVQEAATAQQALQLKSLLVEPSWLRVLGPEFDKPYMQQLQGFLHQEWASQVIYPPQDCIFRAFNAVPLDQVRVVILGQDPYINQGEAMGLSFSVPPGIRVPPSLANMYKELAADVGATVPKHGCLQKWCSQGVLLLNAALTVRAKSSNSHAGKGWENFTSAALTALVKQRSGIVFLLWGKYAQDRCAKLDMKQHHVLKSVHPSPLSAHRGFLGGRHFSAANKLLEQSGQPPIDWQIEDVV